MIGKTISHFRIVERIGAGGMGEVFRADDLTLPRQIAIKFLNEHLTQNPDHAERFLREAQAASALDHPNICTIFEIGTSDDGRMYMAMPFYEGHTLRSLLNRQGALLPDKAMTYALGVAEGLEKAHRKGILHRDIKPDNLMVTVDGIVKILDFGVAKLETRSEITSLGTVLGTVSYMSPEQLRGRPLDARSDIFSLGATLYECVTGTRAFQAENPASTIHRILFTEPKPPRDLQPDLSVSLERVILKALAKNPKDRFQSMSEFRQALSALVREAESAPTIPLAQQTSGRLRLRVLRGSFLVIPLALSAVLLVENLDSLRKFLGFDPPLGPRGIVVLPFQDRTGDSESKVFAAGIGLEITRRLRDLAVHHPDLWVVPRRRLEKISDPQTARGHYGVDLVLTGNLERIDSGYEFDCRLLEAGTQRVLGERRVSTTEADWPDHLDAHLVGLLGLDAGYGTGKEGRRATPLHPAAFDSLIIGLGHLASGEPASLTTALKALNGSIAMDSLLVEAHLARAQALFRTYDRTDSLALGVEALTACDRTLALDSTRAEGFLWRGRIRSRMGDKEKALLDLSRAADLEPRDPEAAHWLGSTCFELGRYESAEAAYSSATAAVPEYWGAYEDLGYLYYVQGRYEDALIPFTRVSTLTPDYAPTYNYLGALYYALEDWDRAIPMFEKSFALGRTPAACANLGTLYYMNARFPEAVRMYELALEYNPSDHLTLGNLASAAYWIPEQRERAINLFEQAIHLAEEQRQKTPGDALLLALLGGYYSVAHQEAAIRCIEQALTLKPEDGEILFRAAMVYEFIGQRPKALAFLGKALDRGYSLKAIEHERQFEELRRDERYSLLVSALENKPDPQSGKGDDP